MTEAERQVRRVRYAAGHAGLRLHYDRPGGVYALHGAGVHFYGLTIGGAEALTAARAQALPGDREQRAHPGPTEGRTE